VDKIHNIDLRKSPLSGSQITETDVRRRCYGNKCTRAMHLADLLNDEAHSLILELWDPRPSFEASGAMVACHWSNMLQHNRDLCDLAMARIARELKTDYRENHADGKAFCDHQRELELILSRVKPMKTEIIEQALYGRKSA
jgi:hypothetical protein